MISKILISFICSLIVALVIGFIVYLTMTALDILIYFASHFSTYDLRAKIVFMVIIVVFILTFLAELTNKD